ncbi:MAG: hypothetical protein ACP5QO_16960, partial [Clostridia bacterium]
RPPPSHPTARFSEKAPRRSSTDAGGGLEKSTHHEAPRLITCPPAGKSARMWNSERAVASGVSEGSAWLAWVLSIGD